MHKCRILFRQNVRSLMPPCPKMPGMEEEETQDDGFRSPMKRCLAYSYHSPDTM